MGVISKFETKLLLKSEQKVNEKYPNYIRCEYCLSYSHVTDFVSHFLNCGIRSKTKNLTFGQKYYEITLHVFGYLHQPAYIDLARVQFDLIDIDDKINNYWAKKQIVFDGSLYMLTAQLYRIIFYIKNHEEIPTLQYMREYFPPLHPVQTVVDIR